MSKVCGLFWLLELFLKLQYISNPEALEVAGADRNLILEHPVAVGSHYSTSIVRGLLLFVREWLN